MQILAYVFNLLGLLSMILASTVGGTKMRRILLFSFFGNLLVGFSYIFDGTGINGAASCFLGALQTIVSYFFQMKKMQTPKWVVALYALSFVGVNLWVAGAISIPCLIAIAATLAFVMGIIQSRGAMYRFWTLFNMLLWGVYDIVTQSYPALITHTVLFVFTAIGMIINDRKKKA